MEHWIIPPESRSTRAEIPRLSPIRTITGCSLSRRTAGKTRRSGGPGDQPDRPFAPGCELAGRAGRLWGDGSLFAPTRVAVDKSGNLAAADRGNSRVLRFRGLSIKLATCRKPTWC
jgi:hypothetical protein